MDKHKLYDLFGQCNFSVYNNVNQEDIATSIQSIKNEADGMADIENLFLAYIFNKSHSLDDCCCEEKRIGTIFSNCIQDHKFKSGWTGLHHAVNLPKNLQKNYKRQCISAFINSYPNLLFEPFNGADKLTPLMIAAWKSDKLLRFLLDQFQTDDNKDEFMKPNELSESVLTYSFRYERQKVVVDKDISLLLLEKNFKSVHFSVLVQAVKVSNKSSSIELFTCPDEVILYMASNCLSDVNLPRKEFVEFIEFIMKRKNLEPTMLIHILNALKTHDGTLFEPSCLYSSHFNILEEMAKVVDENTNKHLFSAFLTTFLKSGSVVNHIDQCNIAHFACKYDNMHLLEFLRNFGLVAMMKQYDSEDKRPPFYGRSQLKILEIMKSECVSTMENLYLGNEENIISRALKWSYKEDFNILHSSKIVLLQKCNKNGDSALHLMLSSKCNPELVKNIIDRFKKELGFIDIFNKKGLTPLLNLCCNIDQFDNEEWPVQIIELLVNAGADVNVIVNHDIILQLGGSIKNVTAEWLARMSVFHSADSPSDFDFDAILEKIKRGPGYEYDSFKPDKDLFEKLRNNTECVDYSNNKFKLINLIGDYSADIDVRDYDRIVCTYPNFRNLFYSCLKIQPSKSTTFITPDHGNSSLKNSLIVNAEHIESHMQKVQLCQNISRKQSRLLKLLKMKMGLSYLHLPAHWFSSDDTMHEDMFCLKVNDILAKEAGCNTQTLQLDLRMLSDIGLIAVMEDVSHIINIPFLLLQPSETLVTEKSFLSALKIPFINCTESRPRNASVSDLFEFSIIGQNGDKCNGDYIFKPLVDTMAYLLAADLYQIKSLHSSTDKQCVSETIVFGSYYIDLTLIGYRIALSTNSANIREKARYAANLAIKHLNNGNLGSCDDPSDACHMKMIVTGPEEHITALSSSPTVNLLPRSGDVTAQTKLRDIPAAKMTELIGKMTPSVIKMSERPSLKSDVPEVGYMHWFSTLVNKHEKTTVLEFFHLYKQDSDYREFLALLLEVLGLDEGHIKRWKDNVTELDKCWLIWTMVIAITLAIITVVTSVLFDEDGGFGGFLGIPVVFVASTIIKKTCCRNKEGKYADDVDEDMRKCGKCFA